MNRLMKACLVMIVVVAGVVIAYFATRPDDPFRVAGRDGRQPRYFEVGALPVT